MLLCSRIAAVFTAATLPLVTAAALAATPSADPTSTVNEDIEDVVITGRRPEGMSMQKFMLDFVAEIGDPTSDNQGYARWRDKVCVEVRNLSDRELAQYVADRVSSVALEVGLTPGEPGCQPNLRIFFAPDGRELASKLVEANPRAFRPYGGVGGTTQGLDALKRFATANAPVRWWQITMVVDRMGQIAIALPDLVGGPPLLFGSNSRITNSVSDELWGTYVIVDGASIGAITWPQLTDYIAMVSLAQVNPDGLPSSYNSILNLFSTPTPATGLTDMDLTYLRALYKMDTRRMPKMQRSLLANTMVLEQNKAVEED